LLLLIIICKLFVVNLTEIIQQTVICPSFIESTGPINANAVRSSIDDAMKKYVSTLETKVKSQDEKINKLKKIKRRTW
jgi:hypothetical protein